MAKICKIYPDSSTIELGGILYSLYKYNIEIQKQKGKNVSGRLFYAKEYSTIRLCCGRGNKNTEAIIDLTHHLVDKWLIFSTNPPTTYCAFVNSLNDIRSKKSTIGECYIKTQNAEFHFHGFNCLIDENRLNKFCGMHLRGVICDESSSLTDLAINCMYKLLPCMLKYPTQHFIFIG